MQSIKERARTHHFEPRWPVALAILAGAALLALLPGRLRLFPAWLPWVVGIAVLVPVAAVGLSAGKSMWLGVEHTVTLLFCAIGGASIPAMLIGLIRAMIHRPAMVSGSQLLASSISVWVMNVLLFSLLYWQIDRGGPEARVNRTGRKPDWLFPQEGASANCVPPDWRPVFVDYLFLSYSTATAFSTTDVPPMTARAKIWMMLESAVSLLTLVVVAARAINILGN